MEYRMRGHVHPYIGPTEVALEHIHQLAGTTGPVIPRMGGHIHRIAGVSTTDREHSHAYSLLTGPPIHLCQGRHVHQLEGSTTVDQEHDHDVQLETGTQEPCGCYEGMYAEEMYPMGEVSW
ncbi:MAG: hypothetical protein GX977_01270 [Firmicutes bacterium]|jgi:hypothetical protein|nr:hypothetical protein [Bacillota bacterium]